MLETRGVRAGYGTIDVLHDVSIAVPRGCTVAILGANGAGKTTLLRTIAGQLPLRAGAIAYASDDLGRVHASRRASGGICLIPEGRGIFRDLTVYENVAMFAGGRRVAPAFEVAAAVFPRLGERRRQLAGTLSGGEQQMLAVSRALVTSPALVMFDELSVGLAPTVIDEIYTAVAQLHESGTSLVVVDQYVERSLAFADYAYFLKKGRVVHAGRAGDYRDPAFLASLHLGETRVSGS